MRDIVKIFHSSINVNMSQTWSYLNMGYVAGVLIQERKMSESLHLAFLFLTALGLLFRRFQPEILLRQAGYIIGEYGKYW